MIRKILYSFLVFSLLSCGNYQDFLDSQSEKAAEKDKEKAKKERKIPSSAVEESDKDDASKTKSSSNGREDGVATNVNVIMSLDTIPGVSLISVPGCSAEKKMDSMAWDMLQGDLGDIYGATLLAAAHKTITAEYDPDSSDKCRIFITRLPRAAIVKIPEAIAVESGNFANRYVFLQIGNYTCYYQGGASVADPYHPYRANQVEFGKTATYKGCDTGAVTAGTELYAQYLSVWFYSDISGIPVKAAAKLEIRYPIYDMAELGVQ